MVVIDERIKDENVSDNDEESAFEDALTQEQLNERALKQANDAKEEGNNRFRADEYEAALLQYELALQIASEVPSSADVCSKCHLNRAVCFLKLDKYKEAITECTKALELNPSYTKALFRRGEAHEKLENYDDAISDMKKVLEIDPTDEEAISNKKRLEEKKNKERIDPTDEEAISNKKRLEEEKNKEMIGKLKEMGNSLLGRIGMSLDNFKVDQDPKTGSYSISFQK